MSDIIHEKTPDVHSSIVGGSSASRIMGCPGSVDLLAKLPESVLNESSSYADEGTGLHEIMAYLVENDVPLNDIITDRKVDELWGKFNLHDDRMWDAVIPAYKSFLAYLDTLYETDDDELMIRTECRVQMPGIEGAFGTCDVLIRAPKKTVVWDWKFGQGVPVLASYTVTSTPVHMKMGVDNMDVEEIVGDPETEEFGNDQLMFYARASQETYPDYFESGNAGWPALRGAWPVELIICQPRILDEELSTFTTDVADLENFRLELIDAVEEALSGKGHLNKGSYCRFAKCKTICPLHLNGPVAMAQIGEKLNKLTLLQSARAPDNGMPPVIDGVTYAEALAAMLTLAEIVEPYINAAYEQAHAFMEAGGVVPGHKLVPKRAGWDSWEDEKKTDAFLGRAGLSVDERRKPWSSITPAVARKKIKDEKQLKLLEKYVKKGVSSGTTIAPSDDPRPAIEATATMVKTLADKIASL